MLTIILTQLLPSFCSYSNCNLKTPRYKFMTTHSSLFYSHFCLSIHFSPHKDFYLCISKLNHPKRCPDRSAASRATALQHSLQSFHFYHLFTEHRQAPQPALTSHLDALPSLNYLSILFPLPVMDPVHQLLCMRDSSRHWGHSDKKDTILALKLLPAIFDF